MTEVDGYGWLLAPLAVLGLGLAALAPLGMQVLRRGVVFIDLAVAQAAAAAALWVATVVDHPNAITTHAAAAAGALACAAAVAWLARRWPAQREALIGLLYALGASTAMLGARQDPHGRERMAELLAADVLWAQGPQVAVVALAGVGVALVRRQLDRDAVFYVSFALVTSLVVPVLGLLVVLGLLLAPALWYARQQQMAWALGVPAAALCGGMGWSWWFDWPSGVCVAAALALAGLASAVYPPGRQPNLVNE